MTIEQIVEKNKLSEEEYEYTLECFDAHKDEMSDDKNYSNSSLYNEINIKLFSYIPIKFKEQRYFYFDKCATNIIKKLFEDNVDDDTIIITSHQEHPKVNKILDDYKNILYLVDDGKIIESDIFKLVKKIKKYKRAFVYLIGTTCGSGHIMSNTNFRIIKHCLQMNNIPHVFVLDAVQELFLLPRDYSMFDYVIGTAHALIPEYDMGICIGKNKENIIRYVPTAIRFSNLLAILKKRQDFLNDFSNQMELRYRDYAKKYHLKCENSIGHLFTIGDNKGTLRDIIPDSQIMFDNITVSKDRITQNVIFRGCWALFDRVMEKLGTNNDHLFYKLLNDTDKFLGVS